jgi:hypothetical protein
MQEKKPPAKPKLTDAERHKRFVETAKKVEASEQSGAFDSAFDSLTRKVKPTQQVPS